MLQTKSVSLPVCSKRRWGVHTAVAELAQLTTGAIRIVYSPHLKSRVPSETREHRKKGSQVNHTFRSKPPMCALLYHLRRPPTRRLLHGRCSSPTPTAVPCTPRTEPYRYLLITKSSRQSKHRSQGNANITDTGLQYECQHASMLKRRTVLPRTVFLPNADALVQPNKTEAMLQAERNA